MLHLLCTVQFNGAWAYWVTLDKAVFYLIESNRLYSYFRTPFTMMLVFMIVIMVVECREKKEAFNKAY